MKPCGYTLLLGWVPTLRYYENRLVPLRNLEERGLLRSFRVEPSEAGGRLDRTELLVTSSQLTLISILSHKKRDRSFRSTVQNNLTSTDPAVAPNLP